jgi:hypothetical protein
MEKFELNADYLNKNLISLPSKRWKTDFFLEYDWHFAVLTDDNEIIFSQEHKQTTRQSIHHITTVYSANTLEKG